MQGECFCRWRGQLIADKGKTTYCWLPIKTVSSWGPGEAGSELTGEKESSGPNPEMFRRTRVWQQTIGLPEESHSPFQPIRALHLHIPPTDLRPLSNIQKRNQLESWSNTLFLLFILFNYFIYFLYTRFVIYVYIYVVHSNIIVILYIQKPSVNYNMSFWIRGSAKWPWNGLTGKVVKYSVLFCFCVYNMYLIYFSVTLGIRCYRSHLVMQGLLQHTV